MLVERQGLVVIEPRPGSAHGVRIVPWDKLLISARHASRRGRSVEYHWKNGVGRPRPSSSLSVTAVTGTAHRLPPPAHRSRLASAPPSERLRREAGAVSCASRREVHMQYRIKTLKTEVEHTGGADTRLPGYGQPRFVTQRLGLPYLASLAPTTGGASYWTLVPR
jgi:hypothetical protein